MNAETIVAGRRGDWSRLEALLSRPDRGASRLGPAEILELSALYRAAATDAARVRAAGADDGTVAYLDRLLALAHNRLYRAPPARRGAFAAFLREGFPRVLRRNSRFFRISALAFFGSFAFGLVAALVLPAFAPSVLSPGELEMYRRMYRDAPQDGRTLGEGAAATSFYIQHNTSIAFRLFATGIFAGLGSFFMLVYQGLAIGTVFGFLVGDAKAKNILTFTCGHTAWELTALVVAGTAGLRMGWALVETAGRTRLASLRASGPEVFQLAAGAAVMLAVAALVEAIWSPSVIPPPFKWAFAVLQVFLVAAWLGGAGRRRGGAKPGRAP